MFRRSHCRQCKEAERRHRKGNPALGGCIHGPDQALGKGVQVFPATQMLERMDQEAKGRGMVRHQFHRPAEAGDRLVRPALLRQGIAQADVGVGEIGLEFEGPPVTGQGLVEPALGLQGGADAVVGFGVAGLQVAARCWAARASAGLPRACKTVPRLERDSA